MFNKGKVFDEKHLWNYCKENNCILFIYIKKYMKHFKNVSGISMWKTYGDIIAVLIAVKYLWLC